MAGANYAWCPVCGRKALYVGEQNTDRVYVVHVDEIIAAVQHVRRAVLGSAE